MKLCGSLSILWQVLFCAKVGSQETPGVTGKFGLGITNEAGHRLIEFCQVNALVIANTLFQQHKRSAVKYLANMGCSDIHDPKKKNFEIHFNFYHVFFDCYVLLSCTNFTLIFFYFNI